MKYFAFLILSVSSFSFAAVETTTTATTTVTAPEAQKKGDIDQELTNARLRAATGSKAKLSFQSQFTYSGGSVSQPLSKDRPVLSPGTVDREPSRLYSYLSAKFRASEHDNINVGVGAGWVTPTYEGQKAQIENPYIAYGRIFKLGQVQNVLNVSMKKYTALSYQKSGQTYESDIDHTVVIPIPGTKIQAGATLAWYREFYDPGSKGGTQDKIGFYTFAEYNFSEKFSFRTVNRGLTYYNTNSNPWTFTHDDPTQSAGFGISVIRDVYLYPNVQWVWADIRSEKTNVAMTAYVNL